MSSDVDHLRSHYDAFPYAGGAFPASHPDQLRTVAALLGFASAAADDCRVLEIGCAVGRNLLPMAQSLPASRFLGIDLSARQIEIAADTARQAGLNNVELRCQDLRDFSGGEGSFDYIIAHGIYSWVPTDVREKLLHICAENLSPQGLAYISYDTLPGAHVKRIARDMMQFHAGGEGDAAKRVAMAREIISFAEQASPAMQHYKGLMFAAKERIQASDDWSILHDELEEYYEPVYFEEFVHQAKQGGLQHLAAASPAMELFPWLSPAVQQQVRRFSDNPVKQEQYMDFLYGRAFRASVLCRSGAVASQTVETAAVREMYIAGRLTEEKATDIGPAANAVRFGNRRIKLKLTLKDPAIIGAFRRIGSAWPHAVSFADLIRGEPSHFAEALSQHVMAAYKSELLELRTRPTLFIATDLKTPRATPLARIQVSAGGPVTTLRHDNLLVNHEMRRLLPLMDGTRDKKALVKELKQLIERGEVSLGPKAVSRSADLMPVLDQILAGFHADNLLTV